MLFIARSLWTMSPGAEITAQDMWNKLEKWNIYIINKVTKLKYDLQVRKSNVNPTVYCTQKPHGVNYTSRYQIASTPYHKLNVATPAALSHVLVNAFKLAPCHELTQQRPFKLT